HARGVFKLRLALDAAYPGIIAAAVHSLEATMPANSVNVSDRGSWVEVYCYSRSWPWLFPQHGPGRKHERRIELAPWQRRLATLHPRLLLRGLIHSDGCRFVNTGRGWSHPRYAFANSSDGVRSIFCSACEALGVRWTWAAPNTIYVSRKADVARLDEFIGPKR
ncbi:MAG TPA: hypothetical protein VEQ61_04175, partial [Thermoleophilaceae bacterium]|nr:hypothetical protein [Thermoleophilaceae bacterium]